MESHKPGLRKCIASVKIKWNCELEANPKSLCIMLKNNTIAQRDTVERPLI